jgi:hypothetical protein
MQYTTCCINSTSELIQAMIDKPRPIKYNTFRKYTGPLKEFSESMGYGPWLYLKNDLHVRYYRSTYDGKPCVYMVHSAIEYIWTEAP